MKRVACVAILLCAVTTHAQNWPSFRGSQSAGVSSEMLPTEWNLEKGTNVAWKTAVPGLGHSSPIAWGNRIYVTTALYLDGETVLDAKNADGSAFHASDLGRHEWRLYALDRKNGKVAWMTTVHTGTPPAKRHAKSSYANPTPVTDGQVVVAAFGNGTLACFDRKGKVLWKLDYPVPQKTGAGDINDVTTSPILYKNLVIHQHDFDPKGYLAAYHVKSGKQVWKVEREEANTWSTPAIVQVGGRDVLVTNSWRNARGHDPLTGKEVWRMRARKGSWDKGPAPLQAGDLTIISGGGPEQPVYAIRATASGELPNLPEKMSEHVAWTTDRGSPYIPTPVIVENRLYVITDRGILSAYDTRDGKRIYQERVSPTAGSFTASPVASGGKLYLASDDGEVFVVRAGPKYELLATNAMHEVLLASPAIAGDMLVLRTRSTVYAIAGNARK